MNHIITKESGLGAIGQLVFIPYWASSWLKAIFIIITIKTSDWDLNVKLELPNYNGLIKGEEFYSRLNTIEMVFAYKDLADYNMVKLVELSFVEGTICGGNNSKSPINTWVNHWSLHGRRRKKNKNEEHAMTRLLSTEFIKFKFHNCLLCFFSC